MRRQPKRRRDLASALGLALLATLALGALAAGGAQAATQWHVDGGVFAGSESASWSGTGTIKLRNAAAIEVTCSELTGTSTVSGGNADSGTITINKCSVPGLPECKVEPIKLPFTAGLVAGGSHGYEKLSTSSVLKITACAGGAYNFELYGSIGAQIGEELVQSSRTFSEAADKAAGATGLSGWRLTASVNTALTGTRKGKRFGTGGAWVPYEAAEWTVGGAGFVAPKEESIQIVKAGVATLTNGTGEEMQCSVSGSGLRIFGTQDSDGTITLQSCKMTVGAECGLPKTISLTAADLIGRDGALIPRERVDVSGKISGFYGVCPFEIGTISGSIAATLSQNGIALKKKFESKAESATSAPGLLIDGERWRLVLEVEDTPSGANAGKALGVL